MSHRSSSRLFLLISTPLPTPAGLLSSVVSEPWRHSAQTDHISPSQVITVNRYNWWVVPSCFNQVTWFPSSAVQIGLQLKTPISKMRRPRGLSHNAPLRGYRSRECRDLEQFNRVQNERVQRSFEWNEWWCWMGFECLSGILVAVLKAPGRIRYRNGWFCERISHSYSQNQEMPLSSVQDLQFLCNHFCQWPYICRAEK